MLNDLQKFYYDSIFSDENDIEFILDKAEGVGEDDDTEDNDHNEDDNDNDNDDTDYDKDDEE
ncbi:hypothetical protein INT47_004610 [Mucor saturninus]|uniref:Uncharacterized protein n=1 Tax=Mucor saturninus TaxID=64648 RepID=A0A8H7RJW9_9FUNG|nr:hypothetical protein INT47_004610 [Mucor saturninus]